MPSLAEADGAQALGSEQAAAQADAASLETPATASTEPLPAVRILDEFNFGSPEEPKAAPPTMAEATEATDAKVGEKVAAAAEPEKTNEKIAEASAGEVKKRSGSFIGGLFGRRSSK